MKKTILTICTAVLSIAILLTGCGKSSEQTASDGQVASVSSTQEKKEGNLNPLTGLSNMGAGGVGKRPYAVMVSNIKQALPQYGLGSADLCYEVLAEGGITRIMALFADPTSVPTTGPVRSVRDYYLDLSAPHQSIFVHFGGSPLGYQSIKDHHVNDIDGMTLSTVAFNQDKKLAASKGKEHSYFVTADTLAAGLKKKNYNTSAEVPSAFSFADDEYTPDGGAAQKATVTFSTYCKATFDYDAQTKTYLKGEFGQKQIDANTGKQIAVDNVLVLTTPCTPIPGDKSNRISVSLNSGSGYYLTRGQKTDIRWSKGSYSNPLTIKNTAGETQQINRGKTWVCIIPTGNQVSFS